ncbi:MAG TPA: hypothetical protein VD862_03670 [Candidatus Paceibacterota bacterium]|nr:hypothetical protein [Candidatus Paceibacterota bacterium]
MESFTSLLASAKPKEPHAPVNFWVLIILSLVCMVAAIRFLGESGPADAPVASGTPSERAARVYTVTYKFGVFSPTNLRIHAGDTVTFRNEGPRSVRIAGTLNPRTGRPEFDSNGPVPVGSSFAFTFAEGGVFAYHNSENEQEAGVIIVRAP